jgi:isoleucyl-tRNA synthetase
LLAQKNVTLREELQRATALGSNMFNTLNKIEDLARIGEQKKRWDTLKAIRSAMLKATEPLREQNSIKRSLDARIAMFLDPNGPDIKRLQQFFDDLEDKGESAEKFFKDFSILSQFEFVPTPDRLIESYPGVYLRAEKAEGEKCPRCWQWAQTEHEHHLCDRCYEIVK